jgi:O-succinylbenzoate synthase
MRGAAMPDPKLASLDKNKQSEQRDPTQFSNYILDYWDFAEKTIPTAIKTLKDVYSVWIRTSKSVIQAQSQFMERMGVDSVFIRESVNMSHQVLTLMEEAQKRASNAAIDSTIEISARMRQAAKPQNAEE